MAIARGTGGALSPLRTDSQIDRRIVEEGRSADPYTYAYHTAQPTQPKAKATLWDPPALTSNVADYSFGATPQLSTRPWDPLAGSPLANAQAPQVAPVQFNRPTGGAYTIDPNDVGLDLDADYGLEAWAQAIADQLRYGQTERLDAAREQQVARGMGRSGEAILAEDEVRRQTDLAIAQAQAEASVEQARLTQDTHKAYATLKTEREMSNQRAVATWQQLISDAEQFASNLEMTRRLANQEAQIQWSGQQREYAGLLTQLETQRAMANQKAQTAYERMRMEYNSFLKELDLNRQINEAEIGLGYARLGEEGRQFDTTLNYNLMGGGGGSSGVPTYADIAEFAQGVLGDFGLESRTPTQKLNLVQTFAGPSFDWNTPEGMQLLNALGISATPLRR